MNSTRSRKLLDCQFKIKELGKLKYFYGIEQTHSIVGIILCQKKYCLDLFHDTRFLWSKTSKKPFDHLVKLHQATLSPFEHIASYKRLVWEPLYLINARPNISFVTQNIVNSPTNTYYKNSCRIIKYLKGSPKRGLLFKRDSQLELLRFSYVDWAGCFDTIRSYYGY